MSFKDFLKITKGKIVLVIILCFLAIYVGAIVIRSEFEIDTRIEVNEWKVKALRGVEIILIGPVYSIVRYESGLIFFSEDVTRYITLGDIFLIITISVLLIFYWYFLSCLIVFVHERLKIKLSQVSQKSRDPYDY